MTSSPAPDLEPRTEAGRRFLEDLTKEHCSDPYGCHAADDSLAGMAVFAIEAEAAAESGRLREALRTHAGHRPWCLYGANMLGEEWGCDCGWAEIRAVLETPAPSDHGAGERERGRDEAVEAVVAWLNELGAEALAVAVQTRHWSNKQWLSLPRYVGTETAATPPAPSDHGAGLDDRRQLFISLSAMCEAVAAVLGGATTLAALADCANVARGVLLDSPLSHSLATPSEPPKEGT